MDEIMEGARLLEQGGITAFAGVLLMILFWLIRQLLTLQKETNKIISKQTETNEKVLENISQQTKMSRDLYNKLISRPCIAKKEQGV